MGLAEMVGELCSDIIPGDVDPREQARAEKEYLALSTMPPKAKTEEPEVDIDESAKELIAKLTDTTPREPTAEEKEDIFREPVDYAPMQRVTVPYLLCGARGNGVIGNTNLPPGSYVQFRLDPAGRQIAVVPAPVGQLLYNEENKRRRFTGGHLLRRLQAKGVTLPARRSWQNVI